jgi:hypothetical protein
VPYVYRSARLSYVGLIARFALELVYFKQLQVLIETMIYIIEFIGWIIK